MKIYLYCFAFFTVLFSCSKPSRITGEGRYKARLEKAAACFNWTFTLREGNINPSLVNAAWTNPQTKETYVNAFSVANPCDLPKNLKEGDEFYFSIIQADQSSPCTVCLAYYPAPDKMLYIIPVE